MAVAFAKHGRLHYADPASHTPSVGDQVVLQLPTDERVATVLWPATDVDEDASWSVGLPTMSRPAGPADIEAAADTLRRSARARAVAKRQVRELGLPMQVVGAEWSPAESRAVIWFSSPRRVDFRTLVRSLSGELQMRVLMRQLNERDRSKLVGGVGVCGRELCCSTFLDRFEPVTLQMARDQDLGGDPLRITGACGRLMCCLRYEHPAYADFTGRPPSPDGPGCADADSCGSRTAHDEMHPGP